MSEIELEDIKPNDYRHGDIWSTDHGTCVIISGQEEGALFYASSDEIDEPNGWSEVCGWFLTNPEKYNLVFREGKGVIS